MSSIPSNIARAPSMLFSQISLSNITRTNISLFGLQTQLSTGRAVNRYSDDAVKASTIAVLDDRLERSEQRLRNLQHAEGSLNVLDQALGEVNDVVLDAKDIAATQLNVGSTAAERAGQAQVVSSLLQNLLTIANRKSATGFMFGGTRADIAPIQDFLGGFRYMGEGTGLVTDVGLGSTVAVTLGASDAVGRTSSRVRGTVDLNPRLTTDTRLIDSAGARGLGITTGRIELSISGTDRVAIDLSTAETFGNVRDAITSAIRQHETATGTTVLGPGGVGFAGGALNFDLAAGQSLQFFDVGRGVTGQDLGVVTSPATTYTAASPAGADIAPRLTWTSPITSLAGITGPLGQIRVNSNGQSRVVDLSGAQTVQDIRNAIEGTNLGIRVQLNEAGTGIDVLNEVASGATRAMSIEEVPGQGPADLTATRLGIRSFAAQTRIDEFNDGRGVQIVDGVVDPITQQVERSRNIDFTITLGDGREVTIDLRPQDMATTQTVIDRINAEARAQGVVEADFVVGLSDGPNGLFLRQNAAFAQPLRVRQNNNSPAAKQLGMLDGAYDAASGQYRAADTAKVRVDNLFTALSDLKDALLGNDTSGIQLAGEKLEGFVDRATLSRAAVGGYAQRVDTATRREEDQSVIDERTRSDLRDLDFAEAAVRLSLLQTQLQAGLQTTGRLNSRTLLDFIG